MNAEMKREEVFRKFATFAGLTLCGLMAGCASTAYERGDAAARSIQEAAAEVQAETVALNATLAALKNLVNKPAPDLKQQFHVYEISLDQLEAAASRADQAGKRMEAKQEAYVHAWETQAAEINFSHIRESSEARKRDVGTQFKEIDTRFEETHTALKPLVIYLKDIHRALGADLTRDGLEAAKPLVAKADENAALVRTALVKLAADFKDAGNRLSSVTGSNGPAPANRGTADQRTEAVTQ